MGETAEGQGVVGRRKKGKRGLAIRHSSQSIQTSDFETSMGLEEQRERFRSEKA